ncbi:MAG: hypothetical protein KJ900_06510 [Proteobacteria bacterium]|jgi:hypothetical protein|nr:hypothetical protein [Desulfocapsa sp.]MBU3943735.1 hypothetical protein [Pseudomonadota bacterium]MCG2744828.1 hypothetical protein [Desulfobacteraceae bacterium]MBU3983217.1 hypothetical protein [Pseudomonadota bacterium]MBU4029270.1 hypothetical protein [Pseudomonadota bacterium]
MDNSKVPQHNISTYANNKKAIYATDENGKYGIITSSGWDVEEAATKQALQELERLAIKAYDQALSGQASPLYFHMYNRRMDLQTLAQAMGMFQWRIKRHFSPTAFDKLSAKMFARYADTLGISVQELRELPDRRANGA